MVSSAAAVVVVEELVFVHFDLLGFEIACMDFDLVEENSSSDSGEGEKVREMSSSSRRSRFETDGRLTLFC